MSINKQLIIDRTVRRLGFPVVVVELAPEQLDDCFTDAMLLYNRYKPRTIVGLLGNLSQSNTRYEIPISPTIPRFRNVVNLSLEPSIPQFQAIEFSILYRSPQTYLYDVQDLAWWQSHLKLVSRIFGFQSDFRFEIVENPFHQYIYLSIVPQGITRASFLGIADHIPETVPSQDEDIIKNLMLGYAKGTLADIRGKYSGIPSANCQDVITLNADRLAEESKMLIEDATSLLESMDRLAIPQYA